MIKDGEEPLGVIIGPTKCGKTTLTAWLVSQMWILHGLVSIVFDPFFFKNTWPKSARVIGDLQLFKKVVENTRHKAIFWDESSTTVKKFDPEDIAFFTQIRHKHKAFFVIGHDFTVISPMMRANLSEAYVFKQVQNRPTQWAGLFADMEMLKTADLAHREFIHKEAFKPLKIRRLSLDEIKSIK
jgi:hypothetical protein